MRYVLGLFCAVGLPISQAFAGNIPEGIVADCTPCVFQTASGDRVQFDYTLSGDGFLTGVYFDGTYYPLESDDTPDPLGIPPLIHEVFEGSPYADIYSVPKQRSARNTWNYYFLHDEEGMHLLGDAPELIFDAERGVFEGGVGFSGGAEISTFTIEDRRLVLIETQHVEIGGD